MIRSMLAMFLLAAYAFDASAQVVPRLGQNQVREVPLGMGETLRRAGRSVPAIEDLNLDSDDPDVRRFAVAWVQRYEDLDLFQQYDALFVAIVDAEGDPIAGPQRLAQYRTDDRRLSNPAIAADQEGYFTVVWSVARFDSSGGTRDFNQALHARTFRPEADDGGLCPADGEPVFSDGPETVVLDTQSVGLLDDAPGRWDAVRLQRSDVDVGMSAIGQTVIAFADQRAVPNWGVYALSTQLDIASPLPDPATWCSVPHASLLPVEEPLEVTVGAEYEVAPRVAVQPNTGQSVVVWRTRGGAIEAQRLNLAGQPVGERIVVAEAPRSIQESVHAPDVDYDSTGFFSVTWERSRYRNADATLDARSEILFSRFDGNGNAAESGLQVDVDAGDQFSTLRHLRSPRIRTRDLDGDFAVAWGASRTECPLDFTSIENWFVRLAAGPTSCSEGQNASGGILWTDPNRGGTCQVEYASTQPRDGADCRVQVDLVPIDEEVPILGISFDGDLPIRWDDFDGGANNTKRFDLLFGDPPFLVNGCAQLRYSTPYGSRSRLVELQCSQADPDDCLSCAELSSRAAELLSEAEGVSDEPGRWNGGGSPRTFSAGQDAQLRWFYRNWRADEATPVGPIVVNEAAGRRGPPGLGMGRDSDMLVGWLADGAPLAAGGSGQALRTQNLAGPVELTINDVGILEGPLTRATANFTLTANKPYPALFGECTPEPSVELLTADDTAEFLRGDYDRTGANLGFGDGCTQPWPGALPFSVQVRDDEVFEDTESFFINLSDESNAIVVRRQGIGAIVDNDLPAVVMAPEDAVEICEDGNVPISDPPGTPPCPDRPPRDFVEVMVMLDDPQEVEGSVEFQTFDGTAFGDFGAAIAGADYEGVSGELQFLPGSVIGFLSIDLVDDGFAELTEQFFVELTGVDNLTLPADPALLSVAVNILDDDTCATPPAWLLPDPSANAPDVLSPGGTADERTGYFCVVNPEGFEACPWRSQLELEQGEEVWIALTDIPFDAPPDGVTAAEVQAAQDACSAVVGTTAAIRYIGEENLPDPTDPTVNGRTQDIAFINGDVLPAIRTVVQDGGDCRPNASPGVLDFLPVGGDATVAVDFDGQAACEFYGWDVEVDVGARDWLTIQGASSNGSFSGAGPGEFEIEVAPYAPDSGPVAARTGILLVDGAVVEVVQEAPFFDHYDDGVPPDPIGWRYTEPDAWSESGTRLTADTLGRAEVIADPAFPGCSECRVETDLRFDSFGKGRATVYMWWRSEQEFLALTADEFFDTWTLVQRVSGTDHVLRTFQSDILVGPEYAVRIDFEERSGQPLILIDVGGEPMCPEPGPGATPCTPWDPDPDDPAVEPVVGSGTVGYAVEQATISFNRLRVIRADRPAVPVGTIFSDGFE